MYGDEINLLVNKRINKVRQLTGDLTVAELCFALRKLLCDDLKEPSINELADINKYLNSYSRCVASIAIREGQKEGIDINANRRLDESGHWQVIKGH